MVCLNARAALNPHLGFDCVNGTFVLMQAVRIGRRRSGDGLVFRVGISKLEDL